MATFEAPERFVISNYGMCTGGSVSVEVIRTDADAYERVTFWSLAASQIRGFTVICPERSETVQENIRESLARG